MIADRASSGRPSPSPWEHPSNVANRHGMKRADHSVHKDDRHPRVALIAHDASKHEMAEWSAFNRGTIAKCNIFATAPPARWVAEKLALPITMLLSGPLGGDAQVG